MKKYGFGKSAWVIDDDEPALFLANAVLVQAGFHVRVFNDATVALANAEKGMPDVIVVDLLMPKMTGFEFCSRLREVPGGSDIPVLVTTALDDEESIDQAFQAGATDFATKPLNWAIEVHRLHYLLRGAEVARQLQQKEQESRLAKEEWERTFNSTSEIVTVFDRDLKVLRANAAAVKAAGIGSLEGRHCYELFRGAQEPCAGCGVLEALSTHSARPIETNCGPLGSDYETTVSPMLDASGHVGLLVHVGRDLKERKHLEAELRQAQKMEAIGTLAGGIAHDFNNLLTVIHGFTELIESKQAEQGEVSEEVLAILRAARRGAALAKQLLLFSRRSALEQHMQPVNLNSIVLGVVKMLEPTVAKNIELTHVLAPNLCAIHADVGQMEQVLLNLAVNSAHAMPNGGQMTIKTENVELDEAYCHLHPKVRPGKYVALIVADTGHGMDKKTQERIYEPFFTTKKLGEGSGLGLSVVFGIVRDHGGYISCYSEVGMGTTFRLCFPMMTAPGAVGSIPEDMPRSAPRGTETILVVDDEAPIRLMLERYLAMTGYKTFSANDGDVALQKYAGPERPAAVILDLGMPRMSGWECLKRLKEMDPAVKVLVATGHGGGDVESRVRELGASEFIHKPYNFVELATKLRRILDAAS